jgi:hypothetical protein
VIGADLQVTTKSLEARPSKNYRVTQKYNAGADRRTQMESVKRSETEQKGQESPRTLPDFPF